jgi:hypothetical protein
MAWLIDTNLLNEGAARDPNDRVLAWLKANSSECYGGDAGIAHKRRSAKM